MKQLLILFSVFVLCLHAFSQSLQYAYPIQFLNLTIEQQRARMAYMDVPPAKSNGQTVLLLHGKNFNGYYWKDVIAALSNNGYRLVEPNQLGGDSQTNLISIIVFLYWQLIQRSCSIH